MRDYGGRGAADERSRYSPKGLVTIRRVYSQQQWSDSMPPRATRKVMQQSRWEGCRQWLQDHHGRYGHGGQTCVSYPAFSNLLASSDVSSIACVPSQGQHTVSGSIMDGAGAPPPVAASPSSSRCPCPARQRPWRSGRRCPARPPLARRPLLRPWWPAGVLRAAPLLRWLASRALFAGLHRTIEWIAA